MIRSVFFLIIFLFASVWLGTLLAEDSGVVLIIWRNTSIQLSLVVALVFCLLVALIIWRSARLFLQVNLFFKNKKNKFSNKKQQDFIKKVEEQIACDELFSALHSAVHLPRLNAIWNQLPRKLQKTPKIMACYFECLAHYSDQADTIFLLLKRALNKNLDPLLLSQFVKFKVSSPEKKLELVEKWLKKQPKETALLLAAGQLCLQCQLWGKARTYLVECLALKPSPDVFACLGQLAEEAGEKEIAIQRYRDGLRLVTAPPFRSNFSG